jgi:hypothetical protein
MRDSFFLVAETLLIVAFSELYTHAAPAATIAGAGFLLTIIWLYAAARMRSVVTSVNQRTQRAVPDFAATIRARPEWLTKGPSSVAVLAHVMPVILSVLWIVLAIATLLSW